MTKTPNCSRTPMRNHNPYLNSIKLSLMLHYVILFNNQIFGDTIKLKKIPKYSLRTDKLTFAVQKEDSSTFHSVSLLFGPQSKVGI